MTTVAGAHDCPGGCGAAVKRSQLACRTDWYRLPRDLRDAIDATYHSRAVESARDHRTLLAEALKWYRDHPRPAP